MHDLLSLTPAGHLVMLRRIDPEPTSVAGTGMVRNAAIAEGFAVCQAEGLIALAGGRPDPTWPPSWAFWRDFASRYLTALNIFLLLQSRHINSLPFGHYDGLRITRVPGSAGSASPCRRLAQPLRHRPGPGPGSSG